MPPMIMAHSVDPREDILARIGDLRSTHIFNRHALVAVYIRPTITKSGIHLTSQTVDEDRHQSKVGLLVGVGPGAFNDPNGVWFKDADIKLHDWLVFRPSDCWSITINNVLCRMMEDTAVRARIQHPDSVW